MHEVHNVSRCTREGTEDGDRERERATEGNKRVEEARECWRLSKGERLNEKTITASAASDNQRDLVFETTNEPLCIVSELFFFYGVTYNTLKTSCHSLSASITKLDMERSCQSSESQQSSSVCPSVCPSASLAARTIRPARPARPARPVGRLLALVLLHRWLSSRLLFCKSQISSVDTQVQVSRTKV